MNATEHRYFDALRDIQLKLSASLQDPRLSGVNDVISNLYRDDAHFVYELLQNADDQGATCANFFLHKDELIFVHNAPKHFTITDPATHVADRDAGRLGDVNSILSIASSSKTGRKDEVPIGKFGLGFKSVFLYTDEPEIFDENIRFSISHYIVPNLIECDHPLRKRNETLFRFRFKTGQEEKAYREIGSKLMELVNPLLFFNHLRKIGWETAETSGYYVLEDVGTVCKGRKLRYEAVSEESSHQSEFWKFERPIPAGRGLSIAVVYVVENRELVLTHQPLYCYLPTANETNLPVILHAPFKLTGNRESIIAHDPHNLEMIRELASLLVESLRDICVLGEQLHRPWIDDNILQFLPLSEEVARVGTTASLDLSPLTNAVLEAVRGGAMLWCAQLERYLPIASAYVADNSYLSEVYPSSLLASIFHKECGWVLPSLTAEIKRGTSYVKLLGIEHITPEKILRKVTPELLGEQSEEWLKQLYRSLVKVPNLWDKGEDPFLRYKQIILTSTGSFEAPFTKGNVTSNVHLPLPGGECLNLDGLCMVKQSLMEDDDIKTFFKRLGLTEVDDFTMAEQVFLPRVLSGDLSFEDRLKALVRFVEIYETRLNQEQQKLLKQRCLLPACSLAAGWTFVDCTKVKVHNPDNDLFFYQNEKANFFACEELAFMLPQADLALLKGFIEKYPEVHLPTVRMVKQQIGDGNASRIPQGAQRPAEYNMGKIEFEYIEEPVIDGLEHFASVVASQFSDKASALLEKLLGAHPLKATYYSCYWGSWYSTEIRPLYLDLLVSQLWIEVATPGLRKLLGLPVKELQQEDMDTIRSVFSSSGIVSKADVEKLLTYIEQQGILESFQLKQRIEEQMAIVKSSDKCTLHWFEEVLNLRLKYVEAGEKDDIEFLVKALLSAIKTLEVNRSVDLRELLPDTINIIFGPPGTGKTTEIVQIVRQLMEGGSSLRILILTPTNAAAKVVAERLNRQGIAACRGINPANTEMCQELEELRIPLYNAAVDATPSVLVSTVHYYSRAYSWQERMYLHDLRWDTIFIDEASMVTLDYVLFALFKGVQTNPNCQFYIVGDPLQLPAITNLNPSILEEAQLDEFNFYSFIGLSEFSETPAAMPPGLRKKIHIRLLRKQYRSVPPLCAIMSRFEYNGLVESEFTGDELCLPPDVLPFFSRPLTFLRFPVTKPGNALEGCRITDLDKLKGSNFHIYSALLVAESLQHLFNVLMKSGYKQPLTIGVITPYIAQKKLIEKLLANIRRATNVEVCVNTIHQFQGDEFDIVMLVLNPPNVSMTPKENILINNRHLINVAISRAKNCLVIVYPEAEACEVRNFMYVNKNSDLPNIESIAEKVFGCKVSAMTIRADEVEQAMYGEVDHLAKISDVTIHEEVNYHESDHAFTYRFVKGGYTIDILHSANESKPSL